MNMMSLKMRRTKLWTVHHPNLEEVWICSTEEKCKAFVEQNKVIWEEYKMDPELFSFKGAYVRDNKLAEVILENMPELYL